MSGIGKARRDTAESDLKASLQKTLVSKLHKLIMLKAIPYVIGVTVDFDASVRGGMEGSVARSLAA